MATLRKITIEGYKSIKEMPVPLELRRLNVLIGANGAGKSNLVSFFELIHAMMGKEFQTFIARAGGGNTLLFYGAKTTPRLVATIELEDELGFLGRYDLTIVHAAEDTLVLEKETMQYGVPREEGTFLIEKEGIRYSEVVDDSGAVRGTVDYTLGRGLREAAMCSVSGVTGQDQVWRRPVRDEWVEVIGTGGPQPEIARFLRNCSVFHFHDTSRESRIRQTADLDDNIALHCDGSNLAAMLYRFRNAADEGERVAYSRIVETFRQLAPWFGEFVLEPDPRNPEKIRLRWRDKGSEVVFGPHVLPDGALRALALITLLLQPREMLPRLIVIDEPELGLHPSAINILAGLAEAAACHCQIVLATQSVTLVDQLDPDEVIVVDREDGASTFKRVPDQMSPELLKEWLDDYSLGQLWEKNVIGGGPF